MQPALIILLLLSTAAFAVTLLKLRDVQQRLVAARRSASSDDGRLEALRKELGAAKEEIQRKAKALEEAREEAKKRARREGKKARAEEESRADVAADPTKDAEVARLKKALSALEQQLTQQKRDAAEDRESARAEARAELERQVKTTSDELTARTDEVNKLQATLGELRDSIKRKAEERPQVPGSSLDLKALPAEAVQELARYFRKAEEYERLYALVQGKLQLNAERQQTLQRRYYAVCRELALAAGSDAGASDEAVRKVAEGLVSGSDAALAERTSARTEGASVDEDAARKKKRRRKKRKAGAESGAEAGMTDTDDGAETDADREGDANAAPARTEETAQTKADATAAAQPEAAQPEAAQPEAAQPGVDEPAEASQLDREVRSANDAAAPHAGPAGEAPSNEVERDGAATAAKPEGGAEPAGDDEPHRAPESTSEA